MIENKMIIRFPEGLHARPATQLCQIAKGYQAEINIKKGDKVVSAKSVLRVMTLGAECGEEILLTVDGEDESEALSALISYFG